MIHSHLISLNFYLSFCFSPSVPVDKYHFLSFHQLNQAVTVIQIVTLQPLNSGSSVYTFMFHDDSIFVKDYLDPFGHFSECEDH